MENSDGFDGRCHARVKQKELQVRHCERRSLPVQGETNFENRAHSSRTKGPVKSSCNTFGDMTSLVAVQVV